MKLYILLIVITFLQFAIFTGLWYYYWLHPMFKCPCLKYQQSFPIAKSSAMLININLFLLLMSRIKLWRKFMYISYCNIENLHKYFVGSFISWSFIHSISHYINFIKVNNFVQLFDWGVGLTGNLIAILLILLVIFSLFKNIKENNYSVYIFLHYFITFCILILSIIHGTFCTIKYTDINCPIPTTWMWLIIPFSIILCEIIYKYIFNKVQIQKVIYNDNILELQLPLPKNYCGKTIYINCMSINLFEWHPFTVHNVNNYENTISIHVKIRGDWTNKLYDKLRQDISSVQLLIDGPYYCLPKNFLNNITTHNSLLISSGIAITNFAFVLQQLSKNPEIIKSKITIVIIAKSDSDILWLLDTFISLNKYIEFIFYFTEPLQKYFPFRYKLGRPNFNNIFDYLILQNIFITQTKITVYYSGVQGIIKHIDKAQQKNDIFEYHLF
jgi:hypothetical protein